LHQHTTQNRDIEKGDRLELTKVHLPVGEEEKVDVAAEGTEDGELQVVPVLGEEQHQGT
jgi:hypothetical protein